MRGGRDRERWATRAGRPRASSTRSSAPGVTLLVDVRLNAISRKRGFSKRGWPRRSRSRRRVPPRAVPRQPGRQPGRLPAWRRGGPGAGASRSWTVPRRRRSTGSAEDVAGGGVACCASSGTTSICHRTAVIDALRGRLPALEVVGGFSRRSSCGCPPCGGPAVSSSAWKPQATTSPMKNVWLPTSTGWRTSHSTKAGAWSRIGAPVTPSWNGKPLSVLAASSTSTGLVNFRTIERSSRRHGVEHEHAALRSPARG